MSAPKNNEFAKKSEEQKASSFLHIRCHPKDKAAWVKAAAGGKLSEWIVEMLNRAAGK